MNDVKCYDFLVQMMNLLKRYDLLNSQDDASECVFKTWQQMHFVTLILVVVEWYASI